MVDETEDIIDGGVVVGDVVQKSACDRALRKNRRVGGKVNGQERVSAKNEADGPTPHCEVRRHGRGRGQ